MTLTGHLRELRQRLIRALISIAIAFVFTYYWSEEIYRLLIAPLIPYLPEEQRFIVFTTVTEPFFTYLKVGFLGAVVVAMPYILYEVWAFVAPALYEEERRLFLPLVTLSFLLFVAGILFAYFVVFPVAFRYLMGFSGEMLKPYVSMALYMGLVVRLLFAFGVAFQVPLIIMVLVRAGIVSIERLKGWWKYALILSLVAGALLTPPDPLSQLLMALPLMALYWLGVALAILFGRKGG